MSGLFGKRALVTGGGTGTGAAIARALAEAGADVWVSGRRREPLEDMAKAERIEAVQGDVTRPEDCAAMIAAARPQIVVANAGAAASAPFHRSDGAQMQAMLDVNLMGVFNIWQAALGPMREAGQGRLIAIASTAGLKGYAYATAYTAAKHATVGLTRALAMELARTGITVNAVCPGFTETPLFDASVEAIVETTGRSAEDARAALMSENPQGRLVQPEEVADAVLWLAGDLASAVTGQTIAVAGGAA